jgi:hypothetical protein
MLSMQTMDILSVTFFAVAGAWLLAALFYSIMILIFLRLRANGQLSNIYDENFGRVYLCGSNLYIPFGWLFRRYARHLQIDEERPNSTKIMTVEERRAAMERLLLKKPKQQQQQRQETLCVASAKESPHFNTNKPVDATNVQERIKNDSEEDNDDDTTEGPMCSICLGRYETCDRIFHGPQCSHEFHENCILDWLQRIGKIECPCCRIAIVHEEEVWKTVKALRKEKKKRQQQEQKRNKKLKSQQQHPQREEDISQTEEMVEEQSDREMDQLEACIREVDDNDIHNEHNAVTPANTNNCIQATNM